MPRKDGNFKTNYAEIPKRYDAKRRHTPEGILPYDGDNLYPQRVELLIQGSATAAASADLYEKHISGQGWMDEVFGASIVNHEGHTMNDLLRRSVGSKEQAGYCKLGGIAIHINYNALLQAVEFQSVPFKFIRMADEKNKDHKGQWCIYDDWDRVKTQNINRKAMIWVDPFTTDPMEIQKQIENSRDEDGKVTGDFKDWKGHLYIYPELYPLSPMDSALQDMETDAELVLLRNSSALQSFMGSYIVKSKRDLETKDYEAINTILVDLQGGRKAGNIAIIDGIGDDNDLEFQKLETVDFDGIFEKTEAAAQKNIRKSILAPMELVGEEFSSGFDSSRIDQARDYFNSITQDEREMIGRYFSKIVPLFFKNINPTGNYDILQVNQSRDNGAVT